MDTYYYQIIVGIIILPKANHGPLHSTGCIASPELDHGDEIHPALQRKWSGS